MKEPIDPNVYRLLREGTGLTNRKLNSAISTFGNPATIFIYQVTSAFWSDIYAYYHRGSILTIEGIFEKHGVEYLNGNKK